MRLPGTSATGDVGGPDYTEAGRAEGNVSGAHEPTTIFEAPEMDKETTSPMSRASTTIRVLPLSKGAAVGFWRKSVSRVRHTSRGLTSCQLTPGSGRQQCTDRE